MKRILLIICIILLIVIFSFDVSKLDKMEEKPEKETKEIEPTINIPEYVDNNPIIVGLYKNYRNGKNRKLIKEFDSIWKYHQDISSFEVYYTIDGEIPSTNQIKLFKTYQENYQNIETYRIGYQIKFNISDTEVNKTILSPKDTTEFYDYLEIYLYDDYHRNGGWYSHTTEEEYNENTLLTSIKLTAGKNINQITSDITLTAFTYDSDDFDDLGFYKGVSKYTLIVKKNN